MNKTKILFISHTFPPTVGGVETHNFELSRWLGEIAEVKIIANTRGRKFLPFFAPVALVRTLFLLPRYDVVLLGSGMMAIIGWVVKIFSSKPVISVVHGLDINYNSSSLNVWYEKLLIFIYQSLWTKLFIPKLDRLIAVGNETVRIGVEHGIAQKKFVFIPNGVDTEKHLVESSREELARILNTDLTGKKVLLTSGRLARRKGVAWFVRNVLPKLPANVLYVIAGSGPDKESIEFAIADTKSEGKAIPLGYVEDEVRNVLFATCDLFVQPNIKVDGDMEGFGISVIEAAACRLPVVAAEIEGLKDAIKNEQNGFLVESANAKAWQEKIEHLLSDEHALKLFGEKARQFVIDNYSWHHIAERYLDEIKKTVNTNSNSK